MVLCTIYRCNVSESHSLSMAATVRLFKKKKPHTHKEKALSLSKWQTCGKKRQTMTIVSTSSEIYYIETYLQFPFVILAQCEHHTAAQLNWCPFRTTTILMSLNNIDIAPNVTTLMMLWNNIGNKLTVYKCKHWLEYIYCCSESLFYHASLSG